MGRLGLRRLLVGGLVTILLISLILSALGVGFMVRGYLWRSGVKELTKIAKVVDRRLSQRKGDRGPLRRRTLRARGLKRFNHSRTQVLLLLDGRVSFGDEDSGIEWGDGFANVRPGVQIVEIQGRHWQVLAVEKRGRDYDSYVVFRPWSPSLKIANALMTYQVVATVLVLLIAVAAVSWLARRLVAPLEELREWSHRVGSTQIEELQPSRVEEVAALQTSFQEMSRRVQEALSSQRRFVADASHELKTPLTAIAGMLNLLESRPDMEPSDRQKALSVATNEAERMKTLVADLLVLSRAQAKHSGEPTKVVLAEAAREQLETLKVLFPKQEFETKFADQVSWTLNRDAFSRIVRNLVENAASHAGGKPIVVSIFEDKSGHPCLEVSDQGPGIAPELQEQLFERFYRVDEGRSREAGGFGLGLPIVKALAEEAGGQISCESQLGKGTTFSVVFAGRS